MTPEQFDRWKDFSLRMARHGWPNMTERRRTRLVSLVARYIEDVVAANGLEDITDWDHAPHICDWFTAALEDDDHLHYRYDGTTERPFGNRFANQVQCCIRAGFDVAVEPSAGVVGFNLGMIRRMFGDDIPQYVRDFYREPLDLLPDDTPLWL